MTVAQAPTLDREASAQIIDGLELSKATHLYDGLLQAVQTAGTEGARSLLLLSDGRDTTKTDIETVTQSIDDSDVKVDVVALSLPAEDQALLQRIADAGNGSVVSADPKSLTQVFSAEADTLARQVLITATLPEDNGVTEGTLAVSVDAGGEAYTDTAFVTVSAPKGEKPTVDRTKLVPVEQTGLQITKTQMLLGYRRGGPRPARPAACGHGSLRRRQGHHGRGPDLGLHPQGRPQAGRHAAPPRRSRSRA